MTTYVPFPELANAIRGAYSWEVVAAFKEIAHVIILMYENKTMQAKGEKPERIAPLFESTKERIFRWQKFTASTSSRLRPYLLSQLDPENTFDFIYANIDKIVGDPEDRIYLSEDGEGRWISVAERWLVKCMIHPDSGLNGHLKRLWSCYISVQPEYDPLEDMLSRFEWQVEEWDEDGSSTCFPGLAEALRMFISADHFDDVGAAAVLREYVALGATAAAIWVHMWQDHGIRRGIMLPEDDHHINYGMHNIDDSFHVRIADWQSDMPLRVRQELARHNLSGDFLFLANHVFPNVIAPVGSNIREGRFGWEMYQYIVTAVTTPEIDPHGHIARLIEQQSWSVDPSNGPQYFYQPRSITPFISFSEADRELQGVELEAFGPNIDIDDITKPPEQSPADTAMCTICQDGFDSKADDESQCVQLIACEHLFHGDCLGFWVNGVHVSSVLCPNCRTEICEARPRRPKEDPTQLEYIRDLL